MNILTFKSKSESNLTDIEFWIWYLSTVPVVTVFPMATYSGRTIEALTNILIYQWLSWYGDDIKKIMRWLYFTLILKFFVLYLRTFPSYSKKRRSLSSTGAIFLLLTGKPLRFNIYGSWGTSSMAFNSTPWLNRNSCQKRMLNWSNLSALGI